MPAELEPFRFEYRRIEAAATTDRDSIVIARGIASLRILSPGQDRLVVVALVILAVTRFVPLFAVQGYVQAAVLVALWPFGRRMWTPSPAPIAGAAPASAAPG